MKPKFASFPLIRSLGAAAVDDLARVSHFQRFPPGTILFREGDLPSLLFIVEDGLIVARRQAGGVSTTVSALEAGSIFPLGPIISDRPCILTCEVTASSEIYMLPAANIRTLAETNLAFAYAVSVELATGYRSLISEAAAQKVQSVAERVATWILANADENGRIDLKLSKSELASLLGISPETLSRSLQSLANEGVAISRASMTVTDRQSLARYLKTTSARAVA